MQGVVAGDQKPLRLLCKASHVAKTASMRHEGMMPGTSLRVQYSPDTFGWLWMSQNL